MNKRLYMIFLCVFVACTNSSSTNERTNTIDIIQDKESLYLDTNSYVQSICSFSSIIKNYNINNVTSGVTNPLFFSDSENKHNGYGFYTIVDQKSSLKPAIIAKIFVSYDNSKSWVYDDTTQNVLCVIVYDSLFDNICVSNILKNNKLPQDDFIHVKDVSNISYYNKGNLWLAYRNKEIFQYMIWIDPTYDRTIDFKEVERLMIR